MNIDKMISRNNHTQNNHCPQKPPDSKTHTPKPIYHVETYKTGTQTQSPRGYRLRAVNCKTAEGKSHNVV